MNTKYYISNNFEFIRGLGNLVPSIASATHMSHSEAHRFMFNHPDHTLVRVNKKKRNNSYVVSTKQIFLGENNEAVYSMNNAKVFSSPTEAYNYLDNTTSDINNLLGNPRVIDEKYRNVKRGCDTPQYKKLTKDNTGRISFTPLTKDVVAKKSLNTCAICGKPIYSYQDDFSVDHIVPLSRGGTNDLNNLRATHKLCNTLKDSMTDEEMYSAVGDIVCHNVISNPNSELGLRVIRSMVRGMLKDTNHEV